MHRQMDELSAVARRLLPSMLDPSSGLFSQKAVWTPNGLQRLGENPLYSAMSTVGILTDASLHDGPSFVSIERTLEVLLDVALRGDCTLSVLGTTTWSLALAGDAGTGPALEMLERRFNASASSTAEIGLVLAGLAAVMAAFPMLRDRASVIAETAAKELLGRFSDQSQLFRGTSFGLRPRRLLHWKMTTFAAQVYPVHGLARYAEVSQTNVPSEIRKVADRLVQTQGSLGQWWWVYAPSTGDVLDGYPVYSVHQDAMAFMALAAAQNVGLGPYRAELGRGLAWMFGENELRRPLVDFERPFIFRCIQRAGGDADGFLGMSRPQRRALLRCSWRLGQRPSTVADLEELEILEECRPYHLGWLLYARSLIRDW